MKSFINECFNNGIVEYISKKETGKYNKTHFFELYVIELLVSIYGEINILNPYKMDNSRSLKDNLRVYGLSAKDVNDFFEELNNYNIWLNSAGGQKTESINNICLILIEMIILKSLSVDINSSELNLYDSFLNCNNELIKRIVSIGCNNFTNISSIWNRKKKIYICKNRFTLLEIEADFLSDTMYERHGISRTVIKQLSNMKVNEVNDIIKDEEEKKKNAWIKPLKLSLSSGSGFVDTIVLLSIMLTEIMIGFIVALTIARF